MVSSKNDGAHKARGYNRGRGARRSNAFDVAPEGAEAAPRSFKGYTLGSYAPNNLAVNPPPILPTPPQSPPRSSRFRPLSSFSLFDEIELRGATSLDRCGSNTNGGGGGGAYGNDQSNVTDEEGCAVCGLSILGPLAPLLGAVTLRHVGWSSILLDSTLLIWRIILCALSLSTSVTSTVLGIRRGAYFLPFFATITTIVHLRYFALALKYRSNRDNFQLVNTPRKYFAVDAFMYQSGVTLQCFAIVIYLSSFTIPLFEVLVRATPTIDASTTLSVILTCFCVFDIFITPLPFRLLYVLPTALYSAVLAALSLRRVSDRNLAVAALLAAFATTVMIGVILNIYARVIYILIHRNRMLFALKANTPFQVLNDVNNGVSGGGTLAPVSPTNNDINKTFDIKNNQADNAV